MKTQPFTCPKLSQTFWNEHVFVGEVWITEVLQYHPSSGLALLVAVKYSYLRLFCLCTVSRNQTSSKRVLRITFLKT